MPQLAHLTLYGNPIVAVDDAVFRDIPLLSVPPAAWSLTVELVGTPVRPQDLPTVIGSNAVPATFSPLALNPTPRSCTATLTLYWTSSHALPVLYHPAHTV